MVGAPRMQPMNTGLTIVRNQIEDRMEILGFVRSSGAIRPERASGARAHGLSGSLKCSGNLAHREAIAIATNRSNELRIVRVSFDLLSQPRNSEIHRASRGAVDHAPDVEKQLVPVDRLVAMGGEALEYLELAMGQVYFSFWVLRCHFGEVDNDLAEGDLGRGLGTSSEVPHGSARRALRSRTAW